MGETTSCFPAVFPPLPVCCRGRWVPPSRLHEAFLFCFVSFACYGRKGVHYYEGSGPEPGRAAIGNGGMFQTEEGRCVCVCTGGCPPTMKTESFRVSLVLPRQYPSFSPTQIITPEASPSCCLSVSLAKPAARMLASARLFLMEGLVLIQE